ncbi:hypothetical protein Tco_1217353 [Tanacetum coccineum]
MSISNVHQQSLAHAGFETRPLMLERVRLAKRLTEDSYDDLFVYLSQYEKLINASRAKKLEKSHDPFALVAHMGSSPKTSSPYYFTHPSSVVDYDDDYQGDAFQNNYEDLHTSAMINYGNDGRNTRCSFVLEEIIEGNNVQNDAGNTQRTLQTMSSGSFVHVQCYNCSEKGVSLTDEQNDFLVADVSRMEEIEELRPSYDSAFVTTGDSP